MLSLDCPWCGARPETEFRCGGEAHLQRPDPQTASDAEWAAYLFHRTNPRGVHRERWVHVHGCGRWFLVERDTVSDRIARVHRLDAPR